MGDTYTLVFGYIYIYFSPACSAPPSAPRHRAGVYESEVYRAVGGEGVSSFEKKVEGRTYVVKAEGPGPRGGCWGTAEVDGARREYAIAFGRRVAGDVAVGYAGADQ